MTDELLETLDDDKFLTTKFPTVTHTFKKLLYTDANTLNIIDIRNLFAYCKRTRPEYTRKAFIKILQYFYNNNQNFHLAEGNYHSRMRYAADEVTFFQFDATPNITFLFSVSSEFIGLTIDSTDNSIYGRYIGNRIAPIYLHTKSFKIDLERSADQEFKTWLLLMGIDDFKTL